MILNKNTWGEGEFESVVGHDIKRFEGGTAVAGAIDGDLNIHAFREEP